MKKLLKRLLVIGLVIVLGLPAMMSIGFMLGEAMGSKALVFPVALMLAYIATFTGKLSLPLSDTNMGKVCVIGVLVFTSLMTFNGASEHARLVELRETDPVAYLTELKGKNEAKWITELELLDPEQYKIEKPLYDQRLQVEEERKLAEKAAEEEADRQKELAAAKAKAEVEKCGDKTDASVWAKSKVKETLKNPDSADFPWLPDEVNRLECGRWKVRSYVDATNGFGATVRTRFVVIMRKVGKDRWYMEDLKTW